MVPAPDVADRRAPPPPTRAPDARARVAASSDRRRRLLDELLVVALHRALALAEVDDVAEGVGQELELDVAAALDDTSRGRAPGCRTPCSASSAASPKCAREARLVAADAHALAAAAGGGLEQHREADRARRGAAPPSTSASDALGAGDDRQPGAPSSSAAPSALSPIRRIARGGGPMKVNLLLRTSSANSAFSARKP